MCVWDSYSCLQLLIAVVQGFSLSVELLLFPGVEGLVRPIGGGGGGVPPVLLDAAFTLVDSDSHPLMVKVDARVALVATLKVAVDDSTALAGLAEEILPDPTAHIDELGCCFVLGCFGGACGSCFRLLLCFRWSDRCVAVALTFALYAVAVLFLDLGYVSWVVMVMFWRGNPRLSGLFNTISSPHTPLLPPPTVHEILPPVRPFQKILLACPSWAPFWPSGFYT